METLPRDLLFNLLLHLKTPALLKLCNSDKRLYHFCDESNEYFWQQKVLQDYQTAPAKPNNISWKRYYIQLGWKHVPVYFEFDLIGEIWITEEDTANDILRKSNRLFRSFDPDTQPEYLSIGSKLLYWEQPLQSEQQKDQTVTKDVYDNISKLIYFSQSYLNQVAMSSFMGPIIPNPLQSVKPIAASTAANYQAIQQILNAPVPPGNQPATSVGSRIFAGRG